MRSAYEAPRGRGSRWTAWFLIAVSVGSFSAACGGSKHSTSLIEAARRGDVVELRRQLEAGADPNEVDESGISPLLAAIFAERSDCVRVLVDSGAEIDSTSCIDAEALARQGADVQPGGCTETTPLMAAAFVGAADVARLLLERGADPRFADPEGMTPLHLAALRGRDEVVAMLIAHGADAGARTSEGETPLSFAASGGHVAAAVGLLEAGARTGTAVDGSTSALQIAIERGDARLIRTLELYGLGSSAAGAGAIDATGTDPRAPGNVDERLQPLLPGRFEPRGIALDDEHGRIYWAEYGAGRVRSADRTGGGTRSVRAEVNGPIGVAVDPVRELLFWTSDAGYPRRVQRSDLDGGSTLTLIEGPPVNRPRAIAADVAGGTVVWTEAVSGRLMQAGSDGSGIAQIFSSGISSIADRPDHQAFRSLGLAVGNRTGRLYWTELTTSRIRTGDRATIGADGELVAEDLLTADDGVDFPVGIAVDEDAGFVFWTDVGRQAILRARLDGQGVSEVLGRKDGLIEPYGIALDAEHEKIYWTDASRDILARANVDGSEVEERGLEDDARFGPPAAPHGCSETISHAGRVYLADAVRSVAACLDKVDALKAVKRDASDASKAVTTCIGQLGRWNRRARELRGTLDVACRDADFPREAASSRNPLASSCALAQDDADFERWLDCVTANHRDAARDLLARRYLRAVEWLEEVRPFLAVRAHEQGPESAANEALAALDSLRLHLSPQAASPDVVTGLPVTGQTTSYAAVTAEAAGRAVPVGDDGRVRAGTPRTFRDNRDGTVSDLTTGLMWEKKCAGCGGLHDVGLDLRWSGDGDQETIWDWQAQVNGEGGDGFAGYSDWRIPNVKELQSLVDYERFNPAVSRHFEADLCGLGCADLNDPQCSCTRMSAYWSSTTFRGKPSHAIDVAFHLGLVGARPKSEFAYVRAVRGGTLSGADAVRTFSE